MYRALQLARLQQLLSFLQIETTKYYWFVGHKICYIMGGPRELTVRGLTSGPASDPAYMRAVYMINFTIKVSRGGVVQPGVTTYELSSTRHQLTTIPARETFPPNALFRL